MNIIICGTGQVGTSIAGRMAIENDVTIIDSNAERVQRCLLYTSPSPRDMRRSRMPSSA